MKSSDKSGQHSFSQGEAIRVRPGTAVTSTLRSLLGRQLTVSEVREATKSERRKALYPQMIKVIEKGKVHPTDWISGAWFEPVSSTFTPPASGKHPASLRDLAGCFHFSPCRPLSRTR